MNSEKTTETLEQKAKKTLSIFSQLIDENVHFNEIFLKLIPVKALAEGILNGSFMEPAMRDLYKIAFKSARDEYQSGQQADPYKGTNIHKEIQNFYTNCQSALLAGLRKMRREEYNIDAFIKEMREYLKSGVLPDQAKEPLTVYVLHVLDSAMEGIRN